MKTLKRVLAVIMVVALSAATFALCVGAADPVGTAYTLDTIDSTTDNFYFYVSSNKSLSDLDECTNVIAEANLWGVPGKALALPSQSTVMFLANSSSDNAGQMTVHGKETYWTVIGFKAPQSGEYTYDFNTHVWNNSGQMFIDVYRQKQEYALYTYAPVQNPPFGTNVTNTVTLMKDEMLYFVFRVDPTIENMFQIQPGFKVTYTKQKAATYDKYYKLGDFTDLSTENFSFGYVTDNSMSHAANNASIAQQKLSSMIKLDDTLDVVMGNSSMLGTWLVEDADALNPLTVKYNDALVVNMAEGDTRNFVVAPSDKRVIVAKFVAPEAGKYSWSVTADDESAASAGSTMSVYTKGAWWGKDAQNNAAELAGKDHANYVKTQTSYTTKNLTKGQEVYFFFSFDEQDMYTHTCLLDFAMIRRDIALEGDQKHEDNKQTSDTSAVFAVATLIVAASTAIVFTKKRHH